MESSPQALEQHKARLSELLAYGDHIWFACVREVRSIEERELYRFEYNPDTSQPFRNITEYFPYLMREMKAESKLHKFSERTLREYMRLDKVFVQGMGIPQETILSDGVSIYTEAAEALSYDHKTGVADEEPKPGKLSKSEVLDIIEKAKENEWALPDVRKSLDEKRGVSRKSIGAEWAVVDWTGSPETSTYRLKRMTVWEDGLLQAELASPNPVSYDVAQYISKRVGALAQFGGRYEV